MAKQSNSERHQIVQARRSGILKAAARLFGEKGYHRTTTHEIAEAAGVAEGTIYNYFANKEDILVSMLNYVDMEQERAGETAAQNVPLLEALRALFRTTTSRAKQNPAMAAAVYAEALVNPILRERYVQQRVEPLAALVEQELRAHIKRGAAREVNVALVARIALATQIGLTMLLLLGDRALNTASTDELVEELADVFDVGLSARKQAPEQ